MTTGAPNFPCPKCGKRLTLGGGNSQSGRKRWVCRTWNHKSYGTYCYSTTNPQSGQQLDRSGSVGHRPAVFKRRLPETSVYIITAAQNATPVHDAFWRCLLTMAKHRGGELLVVPIRYKNPTSRWTESQANQESWAEDVRPYLWNQRKALNQNITLLGDIKTQPTASSPLTGFDAISGASSAILGHTKLQLRTIPAPASKMAKILATTGACTVPNYTDSKVGKLGAFHHVLAAAIVEVDGRSFHLRQLCFDSKTQSFTDLETRYHEDRVEAAPPALALVMGDTHVDSISPDVERATFGPGGMVETLRPQHLVWHDLLDGYSVNPHHRGKPFIGVAKAQSGRGNVVAEVQRACKFVAERTPAGATSVVVPSNHNDFLERWIENTDWRLDPSNAEFYLSTALKMVKRTRYLDGHGTVCPAPFAMVFPEFVDVSRIRLLERDESIVIGGIEIGMHGDRGPNGSRGSLLNHRRLGVKSIIGHCLTREHDVLVSGDGWRPIESVGAGSELLTFDHRSGRNRWAIAPEKQEYEYTGTLIRIRHQGAFDQEITPNHRLMLSDGSAPNVCEAVVTRSPALLPISALAEDGGNLDLNETTLRRIVAVAADGSFFCRSLTFNLKKERKRARLEMLFGDALRNARAPDPTTGAIKRTVRMDSQAYRDVVAWIEPTSQAKRLPAAFMGLTARCRAIVLDELKYWDGTFIDRQVEPGRSGQQFSTYKEAEARMIGAMCTMQGYRCTLAKRQDSRGWIVSWCEDREHRHVTAHNHDEARRQAWGASTRDVIDEPVYCFTVSETGCFWVRSQRTGLISLTHNSHVPGIEEGAWQTGTSTGLRLEYTVGPSSWLNAHCLINADGRRQLIVVPGRVWRLRSASGDGHVRRRGRSGGGLGKARRDDRRSAA